MYFMRIFLKLKIISTYCILKSCSFLQVPCNFFHLKLISVSHNQNGQAKQLSSPIILKPFAKSYYLAIRLSHGKCMHRGVSRHNTAS